MSEKIVKTKRQRLVSLLAMIFILFAGFVVFGLMVNWNLFYVIGGFIPILLVGVGLIYLPGVYAKLQARVEKKIEEKLPPSVK